MGHGNARACGLRLATVARVGLVSLGLMSSGLAATGCAKKPLIVQADPPPLEVPIVPPRLLGPVAVEEPPPPTPETPEPAPARPGRGTRPPAGRPSDPVVKVEPPPEGTKTPDATGTEPAAGGSTSTAAAEPAPLLRTDTADDAEVARKVREVLARANENLNKVNYNNLNAGAKSQFDTARRFIVQSEEALKSRNFTFSRYVADKAENISASLLNK